MVRTSRLGRRAICAGLALAPLLSLVCLTSCGDASSGKRRIAVIPKGTTHEFWKSIHAGALRVAQELGVEIIWQGPLKEDDRSEQIKVVESFIAKGVDGIVIAPLDDKALVRPLKEASNAGIPVLVVDSDVKWEGRKSFVATDNRAGGAAAARAVAERIGGKGKVLMLRYLEGSASTEKRESGFLDTMKKDFPGIEVLGSKQRAGATVESAMSASETLLTQHGDVDAIFCPCEPVVVGMLRALQDSGRAGKIPFVGFDASEKLVQALEKGEIAALIVQDPVRMGAEGVRRMVEILDGKSVPSRVDTGVAVITKDSMTSPEHKALLAPDLSILKK